MYEHAVEWNSFLQGLGATSPSQKIISKWPACLPLPTAWIPEGFLLSLVNSVQSWCLSWSVPQGFSQSWWTVHWKHRYIAGLRRESGLSFKVHGNERSFKSCKTSFDTATPQLLEAVINPVVLSIDVHLQKKWFGPMSFSAIFSSVRSPTQVELLL